jgi:hypothetical protein
VKKKIKKKKMNIGPKVPTRRRALGLGRTVREKRREEERRRREEEKRRKHLHIEDRRIRDVSLVRIGYAKDKFIHHAFTWEESNGTLQSATLYDYLSRFIDMKALGNFRVSPCMEGVFIVTNDPSKIRDLTDVPSNERHLSLHVPYLDEPPKSTGYASRIDDPDMREEFIGTIIDFTDDDLKGLEAATFVPGASMFQDSCGYVLSPLEYELRSVILFNVSDIDDLLDFGDVEENPKQMKEYIKTLMSYNGGIFESSEYLADTTNNGERYSTFLSPHDILLKLIYGDDTESSLRKFLDDKRKLLFSFLHFASDPKNAGAIEILSKYLRKAFRLYIMERQTSPSTDLTLMSSVRDRVMLPEGSHMKYSMINMFVPLPVTMLNFIDLKEEMRGLFRVTTYTGGWRHKTLNLAQRMRAFDLMYDDIRKMREYKEGATHPTDKVTGHGQKKTVIVWVRVEIDLETSKDGVVPYRDLSIAELMRDFIAPKRSNVQTQLFTFDKLEEPLSREERQFNAMNISKKLDTDIKKITNDNGGLGDRSDDDLHGVVETMLTRDIKLTNELYKMKYEKPVSSLFSKRELSNSLTTAFVLENINRRTKTINRRSVEIPLFKYEYTEKGEKERSEYDDRALPSISFWKYLELWESYKKTVSYVDIKEYLLNGGKFVPDADLWIDFFMMEALINGDSKSNIMLATENDIKALPRAPKPIPKDKWTYYTTAYDEPGETEEQEKNV